MSKIAKAAINAVVAAFASDAFSQQAEDAKATVAAFLLALAKKCSSAEQFNAEVQKLEDWAKSEEGRAVILKAGYKVNQSKKGKYLMPRAWIQAASDLRATYKYGVDLNATTKDTKTGKEVPIVDTLSVARKLKTEARNVITAQEDATKPPASNHEAVKRQLRALNQMVDDLTDGQAASLAHQLERIVTGLKAAPQQDTTTAEGKRVAH